MMAEARKVAVVVGASRGIGFELARLLSEQGHHVFATCRTTNDAIDSIAHQRTNYQPVPNIVFDTTLHFATNYANALFRKRSDVDVAVEGGCEPLTTLKIPKVDTVFLNAGILEGDSLETLNFQDMTWQFQVNAVGPLRAVQALLPHLGSDSKVVLIGSKLGSFQAGSQGGRYGYRMSKAAAHMAAWTLSADVKSRGVAVGVIHPGVVESDMTRKSGSKTEITAAESAACILKLVPTITMESSGCFIDYKGNPMPW